MKNLFMVMTLLMIVCIACNKPEDKAPVRVVTELNVGESRDIMLSNGETVNLTLLGISDERDSLRNAIRDVEVRVRIDGDEYTLGSGNYNLPIKAGRVQIDCPVVKDYYDNSNSDHWGLTGDARFRLWPAGSTFMQPGTFVYPIKQVWFASMTQSGNEPTYVDWGENPENKSIYYHSGHDMGGAEGMDEILSATDGLVISSAGDTLEGYTDFPGDIRPDVVWILTDWGWYIRYSHMDSIDPGIRTGNRVSINQRIGLIGKQGGSGGWVHLHFEMMNRETASGKWGTEDAYAYVWEAYVNQYHPDVIAVARPHHLVWTGEPAVLDGSKSKSLTGEIMNYEWTFSDGSTAEGAIQERSYQDPGEYSEILKVTDSHGHVDYDFTVVQVYDREVADQTIPTIQPAFHPTLDIHPGDPITFLVRTFNTATGSETWDFGDGSPTVSVVSETVDRRNYTAGKFAETIHSFNDPGDYIVKVERSDEAGIKATAHLHVVVDDIK